MNRHIVVPVTVNKSRPLSFILDTGASAAIIRTEVANELGLTLEGQVNVGGAGAGRQAGSFVRNAKWSLVGLNDFSQPIAMALPLDELGPGMGQRIDGIIGGEFIRQFVLELDYQQRYIRLHKPESFRYTGSGQTLPLDFFQGHSVVTATVTPTGGRPIERQFMLDIGAGSALVLHSPFVNEHHLLDGNPNTVRSIGGAGAGGKTTGQLGRVESLALGKYVLKNPFTVFSQDTAGSFANAQLAGNIGAQVAMRFHLFFDYGRQKLILEPSSMFADPFERAIGGVAFRALGNDFHTFTVVDVLEGSAAVEAGIKEGDVITAINDIPAAQLTLTKIIEMFEKPDTYRLTIRRGDTAIAATLRPRRMN